MRFVSPETVRIDLANGEWIDIKKELTVGEDKAYRTAGFSRVSQGDNAPEISVNFSTMAMARAHAYIVGWSATVSKTDPKTGEVTKTPKPYTPDALKQLDTESFDEIDAAIQAHIEKVLAEKKVSTVKVA